MRGYRLKQPEDSIKHNLRRKQKRMENKIKLINHYSNGKMECICCGVKEIQFLTLDHINGGGAEHRRIADKGAGSDFYAWLLRNKLPGGIQVLCYNCNCAKNINGICPHLWT